MNLAMMITSDGCLQMNTNDTCILRPYYVAGMTLLVMFTENLLEAKH